MAALLGSQTTSDVLEALRATVAACTLPLPLILTLTLTLALPRRRPRRGRGRAAGEQPRGWRGGCLTDVERGEGP